MGQQSTGRISGISVTTTSTYLSSFPCPELFPTTWSAVIFVSYMALFINQGILITATKAADNSYSYNTTSVVLLTECLKLITACLLYVKDNSWSQLHLEVTRNTKVFGLYFVPALLYCLYNNLAFVNLAAFDPTTYFLLLQFRVVVTGVIFQIIFKKKLSGKQWSSLVLLTFGCIVKQMPSGDGVTSWTNFALPEQSFNLLLVILQVFCSCFAGVYNEFLLKKAGTDVPVMVQNVFLYINSIACNVGVLAMHGGLSDAMSSASLASLFQWKVASIVANNAAIGIVTSFFLHSLNSILKTFASALELMFTAVLCWFIFDIAVDQNTVLAIAIVSFATYVYSQNPVINKPPEMKKTTDEDSQELLQKV